MALVNHDKVVGAPVEAIEGDAGFAHAALAREVGMVEHVVSQTVGGDGVVHHILVVREPVVLEFLRAQHQDVAVAALVVLDYGKGGKCLAEAN